MRNLRIILFHTISICTFIASSRIYAFLIVWHCVSVVKETSSPVWIENLPSLSPEPSVQIKRVALGTRLKIRIYSLVIWVSHRKSNLHGHSLNFSSSGNEAKKLFDDAKDMLKKVTETKSLRATGVVAFFPANSVGDDVHVFEDDDGRKGSPQAVFYGLRQQVGTYRVQKYLDPVHTYAFIADAVLF